MPKPKSKRVYTPVSETEWDKADEFFRNNPPDAKLRRKDPNSGVSHSFIKIGNEIVALQHTLGKGAFARVKFAETRTLQKYAMRVEALGRDAKEEEKKIMQELKYLFGRTARDGKKYSAMRYIEGCELYAGMLSYQKEVSLNERDKLSIAIESVKAIKYLHTKRILHCDIKAQNMMINKDKNGVFRIIPIDFGLSKKLPKGKKFVTAEGAGTEGFVAPEIKNNEQYSKASDVYALGMMLKIQMGIEHPIIDKMLSEDPKERPTLNEVETALMSQLRITPSKPAEPYNFFQQLKNYAILSDKEKQKVLYGLAAADYSNPQIAQTLDLKTITQIMKDCETRLESKKEPWMNELYIQIKQNSNLLGISKVYQQGNSLAEVQEGLKNGEFYRHNFGTITEKIKAKYNELKEAMQRNDEIGVAAKKQFAAFVDKFEFDKFLPTDAAAAKMKELVQKHYGLEITPAIKISPEDERRVQTFAQKWKPMMEKKENRNPKEDSTPTGDRRHSFTQAFDKTKVEVRTPELQSQKLDESQKEAASIKKSSSPG